MERKEKGGTQKKDGKLIEDQKLIEAGMLSAMGWLGSNVVHEINRPLAGVLGFTQIALSKISPDNPIYEDLKEVEKYTRRCISTAKNLLSFTREPATSQEKVDINQALERMLSFMEHQFAVNNISVKKELSPHPPPVSGNAHELELTFLNIMRNAREAMPEGGEFLVTTGFSPTVGPGRVLFFEGGEKVREEKGKGEGWVIIELKDTGRGIPSEKMERIFEPFFTTKKAGERTGLGLSVSYGLIKKHRGDIQVKSSVGKGTTVIIKLPAVKEDKDEKEG